MAEPTAFAMSKMFSQLTGRKVSFNLVTKPPVAKAKPLYGVYTIVPGDAGLVVRTEMGVIGSLGGALLGLPKESVLDLIKKTPLEEVLRDAMHEILNVAATLVCVDRRAVFKSMYNDPVFFGDAAQEVMRKPLHTTQFDVTVDGYLGGGFAIIT
jgi:hypothetical protein